MIFLTSSYTLENLLTPQFAQSYLYADLLHAEIVFSEKEYKETEMFLRIPSQEELYPYNRAMFDFLNHMEMDVPRGCRAKRYLREREMLGDFYSFWQEGSKVALLEWLRENDISLSPVA